MVIILKWKHFLANSEAIAIMLGFFLSLAIAFNAFWQRIKIFKPWNFKINYSIWKKKSFSFIATSFLFIIRVSSSSASFILSKDFTLHDKKVLTVFQKHLFSVKRFSFKLVFFFFVFRSSDTDLFLCLQNNCKVHFLSLVMIAFEISGSIKSLWFARKYPLVRGACFSSAPVQIFEKTSKPFSKRNVLCLST